MEFNEYQNLAMKTDQRVDNRDELNRLIPLLGMIGEMGSVASEHKKRLRDGQSYTTFNERFKKELGDVLWYIATLARDMGISLDEVATSNLLSTEERWGDLKNFLPSSLYDYDFPQQEQLPRSLFVDFRELSADKVQMYVGDQALGNELDDNAHVADGYRYHDVFHLSYMAVLGWSPVVRAMLNKKRKSVPAIDNVEDGARACIVEEAISAIVYDSAKDHKFYEDISVVDFSILNTVKGMVRSLETRNISSSLWERAIIDGYVVYRELVKNGGGRVSLNLIDRTIKFIS